MITLPDGQVITLMNELSNQGFKVYMYLLDTYTHEWQEYSLKNIAIQLNISKPTVHRALNDLAQKQYIETNKDKSLIAVRIQTPCFTDETPCFTDETPTVHIRNIKRERVYIFILLNIIFLILNKNNFLSLSDIPYRGQNLASSVSSVKQPVSSVKQPEQIYSLNEEFYEQLRNIGIRVNDRLKAQLDYVGAEEVTEIYDRIIWDETIRKPSTIFLKEVGKAVKEKRKAEAENRTQTSNYRTWAGSRELSIREIYDSYKNSKNTRKEKLIEFWRKKSSFYGYTEAEMDLFQEQVIEEDFEES
jgi:hypothetical protein